MTGDLATAIQRYNRAACSDDAEEFQEAHRILRGRLLTRPIPIAAHGPWAYAAVGRGAIGVTRLRMIEGRAGDR